MDLDLGKLRHFVAVARLQHFGRAAEQLYIAQPVLSRHVRALERDLGCELFTRTSRSVQLTAAGQQLLDDAPAVLAGAEEAARRAREAARGVRRLVVGFGAGLPVSTLVRSYCAAHPHVEVQLEHLTWFEQAAAVREGRVDVGLLRLPDGEPGLRVWPVGAEPRAVCLPAGHRLADQDAVSIADLAGETVLDAHARRTSSVEEKLELVASGVGVALLPVSTVAYYGRADVVSRPAPEHEPVPVSLVASARALPGHVRAFVDLALADLRARSSPSASSPASWVTPAVARG